MLHDLTTNGIEPAVQRHFRTERVEPKHRAKFIDRLGGYINFVGQVRGKSDVVYLKHKTAFDAVLKPVDFE